MARSVGESPRSSSSQALRRDVERATWKTETPAASKGEVPSAPLPENEVALTIASGFSARVCRRSQVAASGAFRDGANSATTSQPFALRLSNKAVMGAISAEVR